MKSLLLIFTVFASLSHAQTDVAEVNYSVSESQTRAVDLTLHGPQREDRIRRLLRTSNESYGPNCWNAALQTAGLVESNRYVSGVEFWHWMHSPFCRSVEKDEALRYGDIGSVFGGPGGNHYHSFMRVNDDVIFQKASPAIKDKWEYVKTEKIVYPQFFDEASQCKGNEAKRNANPDCVIGLVYHRCDPIPQNFYSKHEELKDIEADLKSQELVINNWMKSRNEKDRPAFERAMLNTNALLEKLKLKRFNGEKEFARKSLYLRAVGLLVTDANQGDDRKSQALMSIQDRVTQEISSQEKRREVTDVDRANWRTYTWSSDPLVRAEQFSDTTPSRLRNGKSQPNLPSTNIDALVQDIRLRQLLQ